jgi:hypothetical protein
VSRRAGRLARQQQRRRRREQLGGSVVAAIGVVVAIVAIIALSHPHDHSSAAATSAATGSARASAPTNSHVSSASGSTRAPSNGPSSAATRATAANGSGGPGAAATAGKLPLVVLNNTTVPHLAQDAAATFSAGGWTVTKYTNYTNDIISTCAYYDPEVSGAQAAAQALQHQFPEIQRVEPQFSELAEYDSPIVVILTPDWTG